MIGFNLFRQEQTTFRPATPAAAARALAAGISSEEELIHQGTNIKPLIEEPYDIKELQRILSREDLDLDTNLLLIRIFTRMLKDMDQERALFAAESINLIENRYNRRIRQAKKEAAAGGGRESSRRIARLYYELALVNAETPAVKNFYLREAFLHVRDELSDEHIATPALTVAVAILVALSMHEQAARVLSRAAEPDNPRVLFLRAEVAFYRRDYSTVYAICGDLQTRYNRLEDSMRTAIDQWRSP